MVSKTELIDVPPWQQDHCIGGHPAFDFVNTNSNRREPKSSVDRFNSVEKILSWLRFQKLVLGKDITKLSLSARNELEKQLVKALRRLRKEAGIILDAIAKEEQIPAASFSYIALKSSNNHIQILDSPDGQFEPTNFSLKQFNSSSITALLALLTLDAIFRLPRDRIRTCPKCGWLFVDRSKGGRRKWCDMKACGNREKVARHYHTHRIQLN